VKLFQIEEPEGGPADPAAPGAAIGINAGGAHAEVAFSVGANALILEDREGFELVLAVPARGAGIAAWQDVFEGARIRAERALARPVTHAVIALAARSDAGPETPLLAAAERAGLTVLRVLSSSELSGGASPALAAAILAEELAPRPPLPAAGPRLMPKMVFIEINGTRREVEAPLGTSVLEVARRHDIDIEGACEGSLACSTCHVIVDPDWYDLLQEASEDEEDMLDLAFNLTKTSRLGCQIVITEELDGLTVRLPAATRNLLRG
jgi:ferredoxin, 2Fe-2S